jgi:UDP-2,4-diacetamido-2,4,6-trideoxy-beta-L-altropyranose hydrolase
MGASTLVVRADATVAMGTGHVMRCLALAQAWQDVEGSCVFAMAESTPAAEERVLVAGVQVVRFQKIIPGSPQDSAQLVELARAQGAAWLVVDGYHFDTEYQRRITDHKLKLLWVDDNGECPHYYADLVLNQNAHVREGLYIHREAHTRLLLGPRYAMLRREFAGWRDWKRKIAPIGRKVLVTMGGSDPGNATARVIEALGLVGVEGLEAAIVVGGSNPHRKSLERLATECRGKVRLQSDVSNMAEQMAWADVAVSAAGTTCWEMCMLGLPAILVALAENQRPIAQELERQSIAIYLGSSAVVTSSAIARKLQGLLISVEKRTAMSDRARGLVDGGGAKRVVEMLEPGEPNAHRMSL